MISNTRTRAGILIRIARNTARADVGAAFGPRAPASAATAAVVGVPGGVISHGGILGRCTGHGAPVDPIRGKVRLVQVDVF